MPAISPAQLLAASEKVESLLTSTIALIDQRTAQGYAMKNPSVLSNVLSLQNTLLQAETQKA